MQNNNKLIFFLNKLSKQQQVFLKYRRKLNHWMHNRYTPRLIGLISTAAVGILWIIMLFVPPFMGVADDGTLNKVLNRAGLSYIEDDPEDIYNNYYIREYAVQFESESEKKMENSQDFIIKAAVNVDQLITNDQIFDLRFLALIYGIIYLPAVYFLVRNACMQVFNFSEAITVGILAILIFGDISYITYFSSFYPEALWMICLLYLVGLICSIHRKKGGYLYLLMLAVTGMVLATSRQQCAVIGFIIAGYFIRAIFLNKQFTWRICCTLLSFTLSITAMFSFNLLKTDFTITSKFHSMTRGVLFQARNPENALGEFGIEGSYAVLANVSAYNSYPFILSDSTQLTKGFYDKYSAADIGFYYIQHPSSLIQMLDVAIKNTTNLHRSYCGNYEKSYGMPKMAQGIFWSGWTIFKVRSAPQTIGYLVLLLCLAYYLSRRNEKKAKAKKRDTAEVLPLYELTLIAALIGLSQSIIAIVMSGDAEFTQHAFLLGASMDINVYLIITGALSGMKLFEDEKHE